MLSGDVTPDFVSQTVSISESVTFNVQTTFTDQLWRRNGARTRNLDGMYVLHIDAVATEDSGIYECHGNGKRNEGKQAIFQLIVRGMCITKCFKTLALIIRVTKSKLYLSLYHGRLKHAELALKKHKKRQNIS